MRNVTRVGVIVLTIVLATGFIGATSFTSATLTRDTNINVVADTNGIIGLEDKLPGDVVKEKTSGDVGELTIDFAVGSATGVNVDSIYELGTRAGATTRRMNRRLTSRTMTPRRTR